MDDFFKVKYLIKKKNKNLKILSVNENSLQPKAKAYKHSFWSFIYLFIGYVKDQTQTQGLMHGRESLYHWATSSKILF
jgi:hypothetical protein